MNLHNITQENEKRWLWLEARSNSYRHLGIHAWEVEIGTPPPLTRPRRAGRTPDRYTWQAFNQSAALLSHGWIEPLCRKRTRSAEQYSTIAYQFSLVCHNCREAATTRGITVDYYSRIIENLSIVQEIREEYETWQANGGFFNDGQDNAPVTLEVFDRTITIPDTWRGTLLARTRTTIRWQGGNPPPVELAMGDSLVIENRETPVRTRPNIADNWWNPNINVAPRVAPITFTTIET